MLIDEKKALHKRLRSLCLATRVISPSVLCNERELTNAKWYSYRFMSPLEATHEFGKAYQSALKRYVQANIDIDMAETVNGASISTPTKPDRTYSQLWLARQEADRRGIPYEDYLEFCFDFAAARQRKMAPMPNQLGPNKKTSAAWEAKFAQFLENRLEHIIQTAKLPDQYRFEAFRGLASQVALRSFILKFIETSSRPQHFALADWCGVRRILPIRSATIPQNRHSIKSAISTLRQDRLAGMLPKDPTPLSAIAEVDYWPSCAGVPFAKTDTAPECLACPVKDACELLANRALAIWGKPTEMELDAATLYREQTMTRERVRKHRAKNKILPNTFRAVIDYKKLHSKKNRKPPLNPGEI